MSDSGDCGGHHSADCGHHGHGASHDGGGIFVSGGEESPVGKGVKQPTKSQLLTFAAALGLVIGGVVLYREFKKRHDDKIPETQQHLR